MGRRRLARVVAIHDDMMMMMVWGHRDLYNQLGITDYHLHRELIASTASLFARPAMSTTPTTRRAPPPAPEDEEPVEGASSSAYRPRLFLYLSRSVD